jgi:hypothetical protein
MKVVSTKQIPSDIHLDFKGGAVQLKMVFHSFSWDVKK